MAITPSDIYASIPAALRDRPQWVCWRFVQQPGEAKPRKRPYSPHGGYAASHSRPRDWGTVAQAAALLAHGDFAGLGYVFSSDDPYTGVDFDHCARSDGALTPWVAGWLARLSSYSEYSPSGTGVHCIVRATLAAACKTPRAELYDRLRCFTMTGCRVSGTPPAIAARQDVVDALLAELRPHGASSAAAPIWAPSSTLATPATLRERAATGRIRAATLALLDSTGPAGYASPSEADSAIAAGLVGAGLTADEALALILDSERGQDAARRKGTPYAIVYWRRTVAHAAGFVGPVVAPVAGPRVRLADGARAAWRLSGMQHGGRR